MSRPILVFILLAFSLAVSASSLKESSFVLCLEDAGCSKAFFLHSLSGDAEAYEYDRELFYELFDKMIDTQGMQPDDLPEIDLSPMSSARFPWLLFLRSQVFCKDANEEHELDHGCICKQGKHCDNNCLHKMTFDTVSMTIAIVVIGSLLLWLLYWQGYRTDRLYNYTKTVEEKLQRLLDAQRVLLYVIKNEPSAQPWRSSARRRRTANKEMTL